MEDGDGALFGGKTSGELERTQVGELGSFLNLVCLCDWCEISHRVVSSLSSRLYGLEM